MTPPTDETPSAASRAALRGVPSVDRLAVSMAGAGAPGDVDLVERALGRLRPSLSRVLNATGLIVHTPTSAVPRWPGPPSARSPGPVARYSNVELDLPSGERGSRHDHVERLLCELTGAEAAMAVTNGAAWAYRDRRRRLGSPLWGTAPAGRGAAVQRSLAALEATLALCRDLELALAKIPVLTMLSASEDARLLRAQAVAETIGGEIVSGAGRVGRGAVPLVELPGPVVCPPAGAGGPSELARRLRCGNPPVIARVQQDRLLLDPRRLTDDEIGEVAAAVQAAMA